MKKSVLFPLWLLAAASLLVSGCAAPPAEQPQVIPATQEQLPEPEVQPTEPPAEPTALPVANLDGAFTTFIGSLEGYNVIEPLAVSEMMAEEPPFIIDVRSPEELSAEEGYEGYIEGAVVIPLRDLAKNVDRLPSFDTPIVVYCKTGHRSTIAMTVLSTLGWTEVRTMRGGIHGWIDAGLPVVEGVPAEAEMLHAASPDLALLAEMDAVLTNIPEGWGIIEAPALTEQIVDGAEVVLIDVRRPEEVAETGVIEGALHIPLEQFMALQDQWPADLSAPIVVYCKTGIRAAMVETILWSYGYTNVANLKGGITAWLAAGNPTVGGLDNSFSQFIGNMQGYNFIDSAALNETLAEEAPFIIDVRNPDELSADAAYLGHIEGAVNIPLRDLMNNLDRLPAFDAPIVVYCKTGHRSTIAMTALGALGWTNVRSLKGGFYGWVDAGLPAVEGLPEDAPALNAVSPDPVLVARFGEMLTNLPENWAVVTPEDMSEMLADNPDIVLIDVRTPEEIAETGTIEGALQIPLEELMARRAEWPADKNATIIVFCKVGGRGAIALSILRTYGYTGVMNLRGGIDAWIAAGNPVVETVQ